MHVGHPRIHRLGLQPEIELLSEVVGEVGDDVLGRESLAQLGPLDQPGAALEDLKVGCHPAPDPRPLDFHHDFLTGVQRGVVHLRDRR